MTEDPAMVFSQFAADLQNYVHLINTLVQQLASISRIPFHYFLLNGGQAQPDAAITSAEAGLANKPRERMIHFGEAWEQAMRWLCAVPRWVLPSTIKRISPSGVFI
ncbi:hypothetical protein GCM10009555_098860 [Acrocarpospora macrocephala]|uniref:Uncharacterized protein n=1 Tax=Acrocarpospora macrocephala TaxID=150177 RepID=A0A5M3X3K0_9ACTN|nr:hypothetical protein [Acrocarpospora macrocephala]GES15620.1 hypothetical protein Amac_092170 [Acrocarpospora macrocephala]